jgi:serine/threonine-protein kinase ATR
MAARDGTRSRKPGPASTSSKSAEPTSSIFNAQFPSRLSSEAYGTFLQLRRELIEGRCTTHIRLGESVKNAQALICVSLRVCLENGIEPALSLAAGTEKERDILGCLDVIQMVVRTACQALVEKLDPELIGQDIHVPLYAWLIIQLVGLNSKARLKSIEQKIEDLLSSIVYSQHGLSHLCYSRYSFSTLLGVLAAGM